MTVWHVTWCLCDKVTVLLEWHPRLGWCQVQCHVTAPAILSPHRCCCPLLLQPVNINKFAGAQVLWCCGLLWCGELRNLICNEYDVMVGRRDLWSGYLFLWKVQDYFCAWYWVLVLTSVKVNWLKTTRMNNIINLLFVEIGSFFCSLILSRYVFSHASIVSCGHCLRPGFKRVPQTD